MLEPTVGQHKLWTKVLEKMDALCRQLAAKADAFVVSEGDNDQLYFTGLVRQRLGGVSMAFLPRESFPDGMWYHNASHRAALPATDPCHRPLIINNFIIGNDNKVARAKQWGHWFWLDNAMKEGGEKFCYRTALSALLLNAL